MEAIAWREAQGGEPIVNRTAESLDRFYVAKDADAQRALVTGSGPWQVSARDLAGTHARSLGHVERHGEDYFPFGAGGSRHTPAPSLLHALRTLL